MCNCSDCAGPVCAVDPETIPTDADVARVCGLIGLCGECGGVGPAFPMALRHYSDYDCRCNDATR